MSREQEYLQVICPIADKALFMLAASHFDDSKAWDTKTYDPNWRTTTDGSYVLADYPAGDNMKIISSAWISDTPTSDAVFDGLRIDRGPNRALTNEEIDHLRSVVIVGIRQDMATMLSGIGKTEDTSKSAVN